MNELPRAKPASRTDHEELPWFYSAADLWLLFLISASVIGAIVLLCSVPITVSLIVALVVSVSFTFVFVCLAQVGIDAARQLRRMSGANEKKCPFCAERIKIEAVVCRFCHRDLPKAEATPVRYYET
jgi:hypothetical protein